MKRTHLYYAIRPHLPLRYSGTFRPWYLYALPQVMA